MKLSIVILNWNGDHHLKRFLPSVINYSNYNWVEIVIADNGSTDRSKDLITKEFPTVRYIDLGQNYGFAEGYNQALKENFSEYILLLNSDVEVTKGWLNPMIELLDSDPKIAACQPKILQLDHREKFEYAGAAGGFIDKYGYPFCRGRIINEQENDQQQYDIPISVFWASGAALLVRGELWHKFDGFDAHFWAHMEEIDLCWRMKNSGYQIAVCPQSTVFHLGGGSLAYGNPQKIYLNFRNNLFLLYKNLPDKDFIKTLLSRMIFDGIAALHFITKGEFVAFGKVLQAHLDFYKSLSRLKKQRQMLNQNRNVSNHPEIYRKSIIFDFFIKKRSKFSSLNFKTIDLNLK